MGAEEFQDMGSHDFFMWIMRQHEKMAWMLRSFIEGTSA
jgi:starvation-inducible DNA-binding protein